VRERKRERERGRIISCDSRNTSEQAHDNIAAPKSQKISQLYSDVKYM
jgi:hypothetical protein